MYKITGGFSTENKTEMLQKIKETGCDIKVAFKAESDLDCTQNPFDGFVVKSFDGSDQVIKVINSKSI